LIASSTQGQHQITSRRKSKASKRIESIKRRSKLSEIHIQKKENIKKEKRNNMNE
jgi:hypothetical protein